MRIKGTENSSFIIKRIGEGVREIRIEKTLSQRDLANISGVSFSTVTRLENGESISLENFIKILKSLDCASNLNLLLPEKPEDANQIWKPQKKRQRVSYAKKEEQNIIEWEWGDKR